MNYAVLLNTGYSAVQYIDFLIKLSNSSRANHIKFYLALQMHCDNIIEKLL